MALSLAYWLLMFVLLFGGGGWGFTAEGPWRYRWWGITLVVLLLFFVLGLKNFGAPLHGG